MVVKKIIFIAILFKVTLCFSQKNETVILWEDTVKLTWNKFKAEADYKAEPAAITASGIVFEYSIQIVNKKNVSFSTSIKANFYPKKSWYKPNEVNVHILSHEQLHFDITELYVREFRKKVALLVVSSSIKEDLNALHLKILKKLKERQSLYDEETDYSRNIEAQAKWQKMIDNELLNLIAFKTQKP